jgi:hypothetical protein
VSVSVCALFEGDYHKGLAVQINSLVRFSFSGTVFEGFRGHPPPWATVNSELSRSAQIGFDFSATPSLLVKFIPNLIATYIQSPSGANPKQILSPYLQE